MTQVSDETAQATQGEATRAGAAPSIEDLSAAFAPNPVLVRVGDFLIDEETGEVIEWPDGLPEAGRIALMQSEHALAGEQEKAWIASRRLLGRALDRELLRQGVRAITGADYRTRAVAGAEIPKVPASRVDEALEAEIIDLDDLGRLRAMAVKDYDPHTIAELVKSGDLSQRQARFLVVLEHRAGYVITEPVKKQARIEKVRS